MQFSNNMGYLGKMLANFNLLGIQKYVFKLWNSMVILSHTFLRFLTHFHALSHTFQALFTQFSYNLNHLGKLFANFNMLWVQKYILKLWNSIVILSHTFMHSFTRFHVLSHTFQALFTKFGPIFGQFQHVGCPKCCTLALKFNGDTFMHFHTLFIALFIHFSKFSLAMLSNFRPISDYKFLFLRDFERLRESPSESEKL